MVTFNAAASIDINCDVFDINDPRKEPVSKVISLVFDLDSIKKMISRYEGSALIIGKFKVVFKYDDHNRFNTITLFDNKYMYLIRNTDSFINDLFEGYNMLIKLNGLIDASSIKLGVSEEIIQDEFHVESNNDDEGSRYSAYI